jgi:hypothetical protein
MPLVPSASGNPLPRWLIVVGSAAIVFHLTAIIIPILDMPSGPWVTGDGARPMSAPEFAHAANGLATVHAEYLRLAHSYHFASNRPGDIPGVQFEVRLRDKDGTLMETLQFPDPNANPWVRHRQEILASALAPDLPLPPSQSEVIPPAGEKVPNVDLWAIKGEDFSGKLGAMPPPADGKAPLELRSVPQHRVPRNRGQVWRPSEWSLVLARSYARHLCHAHGAATAEIVRHTREPVSYSVLLGNGVPDLDELVASFGEVSE